MEAPSSRKRKWLLHDSSTGIAHGIEAVLEVRGIENHERTTQVQLGRLVKSAGFTIAPNDAGVLRAIIVEGPAKRRGIEPLRFREIADRELDIVDRVMAVHGECLSDEKAREVDGAETIEERARVLSKLLERLLQGRLVADNVASTLGRGGKP